MTRRVRLYWYGILLLVCVTAGWAVALVSGSRETPSAHATAAVNIQTMTGTHANFEVTSYVSDFIVAYASPEAAQRAARVSGLSADEAQKVLVATSTGSSSIVHVAFTARAGARAEAGLRAATREALGQIARSDLIRAEVERAAAQEVLEQLDRQFPLDAQSLGTVPAGDLLAARKAAFSEATDQLESASADVMNAQAAVTSAAHGQVSASVATQSHTRTPAWLTISTGAAVALLTISLTTLILRQAARKRRQGQMSARRVGSVEPTRRDGRGR